MGSGFRRAADAGLSRPLGAGGGRHALSGAHGGAWARTEVARTPGAPALRTGAGDRGGRAIALYIAEKTETLLPKDRIGRARAIGWLFAALNSVEIAIQELAGIDLFHAKEAWAKERRPQAEAFVRDRLAMLERALGGKDYLEGRFTVGDLMMADVLRILRHTDLLDEYPALNAYKERCEARPAFQRALDAQMEGFRKAA